MDFNLVLNLLQGAFIGLIAGVGMSAWVYIGSKIYPPGQEFVRRLPLTTENCTVFAVSFAFSVKCKSAVSVKNTRLIFIKSYRYHLKLLNNLD